MSEEENNPTYNDVSINDASDYGITSEDSSPVEESSPQTTESALNNSSQELVNSDPQKEDSQLGEDDWDDADDYEIDIDGEKYSSKDVLAWKQDADNKQDWNKSHTQKSQNLSKLGKLFEALEGDDNFKKHLQDYYYDNPEGLKEAGLEDIDYDYLPDDMNPEDYLIKDDPHNQLMDRVESLETEKNVQILEAQLDTLENNYPEILGGQKTDEFLRFVDESGIGDLEVGFRLWATDTLMEQQAQSRKLNENRERNQGKVISSNKVGASVVSEAPKDNRGHRAYDAVDLNNPDVSKYFNN